MQESMSFPNESSPLRSVVAVVGGYIVAFLLVALTFNTLAFLVPDVFSPNAQVQPPMGWFILTYVLSFVYATIAGYVTAFIAQRREMFHALALAGFMFVLGVATTVSMTAPEHRLKEIAFTIVGVAGVWVGAHLRLLQK